MELDIAMDAAVACTDGPCGRLADVVMDPVKQEITHIVVTLTGEIETEHLVPIEWITRTTPDAIHIDRSAKQLAEAEPFVSTEFVNADTGLPAPPDAASAEGASADGAPEEGADAAASADYVNPPVLLWPYATALNLEYVRMEHEQIPVGELAIRRGARVEATDGSVGQVDEFLIDPESDHVTHLILREGHLWGRREISIPISAIHAIEEDVVVLRLSKDEVEALPEISIERHGF